MPFGPRSPAAHALLLLMAACPVPALARQPDPATSPVEPVTPSQTTTDRPRSIVPSPSVVSPGQRLPMDPVRPNLPGVPSVEIGSLSNPALIREGAFISNARARVVRGMSGRWFVVFDPDTGGHTLPPMVLIENANLASIERLLEGAPAGARVRISGQTTVYRDRNFFVATVPPQMERPVEPAPAPTPAPSDPDTAVPASDAADTSTAPAEPSMEQIIADLDKVVGARRSTSATRESFAEEPGANEAPQSSNSPADDGRPAGYLVSRRGRLVRAPDGSLQFRTDNGAGGLTEPVYTLLPCQNLTSLEAWSDASGDNTPLTLSGEVFNYRARAYLLPSMYSVPKQTDIVLPTQ